jgi:hypothetical protein
MPPSPVSSEDTASIELCHLKETSGKKSDAVLYITAMKPPQGRWGIHRLQPLDGSGVVLAFECVQGFADRAGSSSMPSDTATMYFGPTLFSLVPLV